MGTLNGYGFLLGNDRPAQETDYLFQEISGKEIVGIYAVQIVVGILVMALAFFQTSGGKMTVPAAETKIYFKSKIRKWILAGISCCVILCAAYALQKLLDRALLLQDEAISGRSIVTDRYVKVDEYHYFDIKRGEIYSIGETVLDDRRILAVGNSCIMVAKKEINGIQKDEFTIEQLDTENNQSDTLIRFGKNTDNTALLGLDTVIHTEFLAANGEAVENMGINESVVYEDGFLFYVYDNVVVQADIKKNEYRIIYQAPVITDAHISKHRMYYIDGLGNLVYYNFTDQEERILAHGTERIWVNDRQIFVVKQEQDGLFMAEQDELSANGELSFQKISRFTPERLEWDQSKIVFQSGERLYFLDSAGIKDEAEPLNLQAEGELAGIRNHQIYMLQYEENEGKVVSYPCEKI